MTKEKKDDGLNLKIESKDIDPGALFIIKKLNDFGFEAFTVGGCIRNLVMEKKVNDWDIVTQAAPREIAEVFSNFKVVPIGEKYGTIMVVIDPINYQISTYKSKSGTLPGLQNDLRCRDFTVNGLAWNEKKGIIDCSNGLEDIKQKIIRFTGDAQDRIKEDPLRMLRAVRLACEFDFTIEEATIKAINNNCEMLRKISRERIRDEFVKILLSNYPRRGIKLLYRLELLGFVMPELQGCVGIKKEHLQNNEDLFEYTLNLLENLPSNIILRLCMILYFIKSISKLEDREEITTKILKRIRFKNTIIKKVNIMTQENWETIHFSEKGKIRQLASRIGMESLEDFWELKKAFIKESQSLEKTKSIKIEIAENNIREILQERPPVSLKDLAVNGKDLIRLGYKEGEEVGQMLKKILKLVVEKPALNQKRILLNQVNRKNIPFDH